MHTIPLPSSLFLQCPASYWAKQRTQLSCRLAITHPCLAHDDVSFKIVTNHVAPPPPCFAVGQGCKQRADYRVPGALPNNVLPTFALCFLLPTDTRLPCPQDIYADGPNDDVGQLQLLTSPLAATDEVLQLYAGGLVPVEIAMPSVLHAIGATKDDIDAALEKAKQKEEESKQNDCDQKDFSNKDNAITLATKQIELEHRKKELKTNVDADSGGGASSSYTD